MVEDRVLDVLQLVQVFRDDTVDLLRVTGRSQWRADGDFGDVIRKLKNIIKVRKLKKAVRKLKNIIKVSQ